MYSCTHQNTGSKDTCSQMWFSGPRNGFRMTEKKVEEFISLPFQGLREVCSHLPGLAQSSSSSGLGAHGMSWIKVFMSMAPNVRYISWCFLETKSRNPPSWQDYHFRCLMQSQDEEGKPTFPERGETRDVKRGVGAAAV